MPLFNKEGCAVAALYRKFGIEMEGYINTHPDYLGIRDAKAKRDGSLRNNHWHRSMDEFGVEIATDPLTDFSKVERIFERMKVAGWHVDNHAGTHVHIEIADFSEQDKAKLLRFCKGIERIIFMFVKDYRNGNHYCKKLSDDFRKIFKPKENKLRRRSSSGQILYQTVMESRRYTDVPRDGLIGALQRNGFSVDNSKYYWLNVYGSRYKTAEFRIFHAVESLEDIRFFVTMAHNIVELVKHVSVEQLEFIILSLYESKDAQTMAANFLQLLGMDGEFNIIFNGPKACAYIEEKLKKKHFKRKQEASELMERVNRERIASLRA